MREIRFRAWDGKQMKIVTNIDFSRKLIYLGINSYAWRQSTGCKLELMQYTGLQGTWEGDIVKVTTVGKRLNNASGAIEWSDPTASFMIHTKVNGIDSWVEFGLNILEFEVIGNIYENPELLTEQKQDDD